MSNYYKHNVGVSANRKQCGRYVREERVRIDWTPVIIALVFMILLASVFLTLPLP